VKVWINGTQYYSPVTIDAEAGTYNVQVESIVTTPSTSYLFDHWNDGSGSNPRTINFPGTSDVTYTAFYFDMCPTLFVWNGTDFCEEGLLNIHAESDITLQHQIQQTLTIDGRIYKLQLRELDNFTSHIDQVKLYAVDHEGTYHLCPLTFARHSRLGTVRLKLLFDDDKRIDLVPTETVDLRFGESISPSETSYFVFEINGYNKKLPP
jgi:hypothetical protein